MKTLGVAGVIASGKSTVTSILVKMAKERGIMVCHFDADKETQSVIKEKQKDLENMLSISKSSSFDEFKFRVRERIFEDDEKRKMYSEFIWSILKQKLLERRFLFEKECANNENALFVFDAALLFSACWDELCDLVLKVVADPEIRKKRFFERENMAGFSEKDKEKAFFLQEKAFDYEKGVDINRNRKIIYTLNNTNTSISRVLELEIDVILNMLFNRENTSVRKYNGQTI